MLWSIIVGGVIGLIAGSITKKAAQWVLLQTLLQV